uniref:CSON013478 protein n=1 Tax=Culicoides sonorensis TaxID=179676 RepID=A0A336K562_CULSO
MLLIIIVAVISIKFYTPAALFLTRIFGFSEFLGGTVVFCFGNSFNKILSVITKGQNDTELFYNEMLGTSTFLVTFISGLVIIQDAFQLIEAQFSSISFFILIALTIVALVVRDDFIEIYEVLILLLWFILYLSITIIVYRKMKKIHKSRLKLSDDLNTDAESIDDDISLVMTEVVELKKYYEGDLEGQAIMKQNQSGWNMFWNYMRPFNMKTYKNSGKLSKAFLIIQSPFTLILLMIIPKVDYVEYEKNWSKFNYIFAIIVYPVIACFSSNGKTKFSC